MQVIKLKNRKRTECCNSTILYFLAKEFVEERLCLEASYLEIKYFAEYLANFEREHFEKR